MTAINRRQALGTMAALPLLAIPPQDHATLDGPVMSISPDSYMTNPEHQRVGDRLLRRAGVSKDDVTWIDVYASHAEVTVLDYTSDGRPFVHDGELARRVISVRRRWFDL